MFKLAIALAPALLLAGAAQAQPAKQDARQETSIPFITSGGARTFTPIPGGEGVYIRNRHRDWYLVRFFTRCDELPWVSRVGFKTFGGGSSLERGDTIIAGRERCRIASIVRSGPPPKKAKKPHHGGKS